MRSKISSKISSKASCGLLIPENPMFVHHFFSVKSNFWGIHTPQIRQIHVYHVCTPIIQEIPEQPNRPKPAIVAW